MPFLYSLFPWTPDLANQNPKGGAYSIKNLRAHKSGFISIPKETAISTSILENTKIIDDRCFELFQHPYKKELYFLAFQNKVLLYSSNTQTEDGWKVVYTGESQNKKSPWNFCTWHDKVLIVNENQNILYFDEKNQSFIPYVHSANAPQAHYIFPHQDFLITGHDNLSSDFAGERTIRWSEFNNPQSFDIENDFGQSDFQSLPIEAGKVQALTGKNNPLIITENQIWQMTYIGQPYIWKFHQLSHSLGTNAPGSVISYENLIFYYSNKGFVMFDGKKFKSIGYEKIDEFFNHDCDFTESQHIQTAYDEKWKTIGWIYKQKNTNKKRILLFDITSGEWGMINTHFITLTTDTNGRFLLLNTQGQICTLKNTEAMPSEVTTHNMFFHQPLSELQNISLPAEHSVDKVYVTSLIKNRPFKIKNEIKPNRYRVYPCRQKGSSHTVTYKFKKNIHSLQNTELLIKKS